MSWLFLLNRRNFNILMSARKCDIMGFWRTRNRRNIQCFRHISLLFVRFFGPFQCSLRVFAFVRMCWNSKQKSNLHDSIVESSQDITMRRMYSKGNFKAGDQNSEFVSELSTKISYFSLSLGENFLVLFYIMKKIIGCRNLYVRFSIYGHS